MVFCRTKKSKNWFSIINFANILAVFLILDIVTSWTSRKLPIGTSWHLRLLRISKTESAVLVDGNYIFFMLSNISFIEKILATKNVDNFLTIIFRRNNFPAPLHVPKISQFETKPKTTDRCCHRSATADNSGLVTPTKPFRCFNKSPSLYSGVPLPGDHTTREV